jgi:predicted transcriptional regulator
VEDVASQSGDLTELTSDIVAAYVSHNSVQLADLPSLISAVHGALSGLGAPSTPAEPDLKVSTGEIRKSIKPDALISFLDGRPYKTLKRHLSKHGLTGEQYRARYGLPHDYPMVASSYAAQRSELAKKLGLGQVRRGAAKVANVAETVADGSTEKAAPKRRGGRAKKATA